MSSKKPFYTAVDSLEQLPNLKYPKDRTAGSSTEAEALPLRRIGDLTSIC